MTLETYEHLVALRARYGTHEFGKLCQKLLAIAFQDSGFLVMEERGVQGVDIDVASPEIRYAVEVKTTDGDRILFERKDASGLARRQRDGYEPVLAVLQIALFAEWMFVRADRLKAGQHLVDALRAFRVRALETDVAPRFDGAVAVHIEGALVGGQGYLDRVLRGQGIQTTRED